MGKIAAYFPSYFPIDFQSLTNYFEKNVAFSLKTYCRNQNNAYLCNRNKHNKTHSNMTTFNALATLAVHFLTIADEKNEMVSAYFNGSNKACDINAYNEVSAAGKEFTKAYNEYYDERHTGTLNYDLAESVIWSATA